MAPMRFPGVAQVIGNALAQVSGALPPSSAMRTVLDRVMVSALRATTQCSQDPSHTSAGREMKVRQLTVEVGDSAEVLPRQSPPFLNARRSAAHDTLASPRVITAQCLVHRGTIDEFSHHPRGGALPSRSEHH